jgi:phytoene dehydrogenase-like protein
MILCPVPDLRFKQSWDDADELGESILTDLSERIDVDIARHAKFRKILTPVDWGESFNLYKGSGLGLSHDMLQVGAFRPRNKDEEFSNLYYVGASTQPGTGLPMVIISSKLVMERIEHEF